MNSLVDNQLPAALSRFLSASGHSAQHVLDISLDEADDLRLWDHAKVHDLIVDSKDEDLLNLAQRSGDAGKFLWVRLGNCRNEFLLAAFNAELSNIEGAFAAGQRIVELR